MKKLTLLFLAPHWRVSLVRAFQDAKTRFAAAVKLLGADSDPLAPSLKVVDVPCLIPRFDDPVCKPAVLELCQREGVDAILPLTNKAVEFLHRHRQEFNRDNLLAYLQEPETIELCHDKARLSQFCQWEGIPAPRTGDLKTFLEAPEFPVIVKPRQGEGSKNGFIAESAAELEFYAQKYPGHVLQKFIAGREFTIDWFSDHRGTPVLIVPRERLAVQGGEVRLSRISMDRETIEAARMAGTRLNLKGPSNLQGIKARSGEFYFTDINLRFGSGAIHTMAAGGDIPGLIFQNLTGEGVVFDPKSIEDGNVMTRFHDAFYFPSGEAEKTSKLSPRKSDTGL